MRFTALFTAGIFAVAATAQDSAAATTVASVTGTSSATAPTDSAQAAITKCIDACDVSDVDCKAKCIAVPSPNNSQVNQTTDCVAQCPQGNGTAAENKAYGDCVNDCIGQYYYTTSGTPEATGSSGSGSNSGSGSATATATGSATGSATGTGSSATATGSSTASGSGSAASSSSTANAAADNLLPMGSSLGLVGFFAALLAI